MKLQASPNNNGSAHRFHQPIGMALAAQMAEASKPDSFIKPDSRCRYTPPKPFFTGGKPAGIQIAFVGSESADAFHRSNFKPPPRPEKSQPPSRPQARNGSHQTSQRPMRHKPRLHPISPVIPRHPRKPHPAHLPRRERHCISIHRNRRIPRRRFHSIRPPPRKLPNRLFSINNDPPHRRNHPDLPILPAIRHIIRPPIAANFQTKNSDRHHQPKHRHHIKNPLLHTPIVRLAALE